MTQQWPKQTKSCPCRAHIIVKETDNHQQVKQPVCQVVISAQGRRERAGWSRHFNSVVSTGLTKTSCKDLEGVGVSLVALWGGGVFPALTLWVKGMLGVLEEWQDQDGWSSARRKAGGEEFRKVIANDLYSC